MRAGECKKFQAEKLGARRPGERMTNQEIRESAEQLIRRLSEVLQEILPPDTACSLSGKILMALYRGTESDLAQVRQALEFCHKHLRDSGKLAKIPGVEPFHGV